MHSLFIEGRRRRRRRHRFFGRGEADAPPTYDEAIQNPPGWYDNVVCIISSPLSHHYIYIELVVYES